MFETWAIMPKSVPGAQKSKRAGRTSRTTGSSGGSRGRGRSWGLANELRTVEFRNLCRCASYIHIVGEPVSLIFFYNSFILLLRGLLCRSPVANPCPLIRGSLD